MPNFPYNQDIPDGPNNPSNDQGPMLENTNSIFGIIKEDHYGFADTNGGLHKQVRLIDLAGIPAGVDTGMGTLYTKLATSTGLSTESNLFYTPDKSMNEYQITRTVTGNFTNLFGNSIQNYNGVGNAYFGGWTFLPGGLLVQYGRTAGVANLSTTPFPVAFSSVPFVIELTIFQTGGDVRKFLSVSTRSTTGFTTNQVDRNNNAVNLDFLWVAIGK